MEQVYSSLKRGEDISLPTVKLHTRDYAVWIDNILESDKGKNMVEEYKKKIDESIMGQNTCLSTDSISYSERLTQELEQFMKGSRPLWYNNLFGNIIQLKPNVSASYLFYIDESGLETIRGLVVRYSSSLFFILIAAFTLLFAELHESEFVRICIPSSFIRTSDEWSSVAGWLTSEIILCLRVKPDLCVFDFLREVSESIISSAEFQFYPMEKMLCYFDYPIDVITPTLLNLVRDQSFVIPDFKPVHFEGGNANFGIDCTISEYKNGMSFLTEYDKKLYTPRKIEAAFNRYLDIINQLSSSEMHNKISEIILHQHLD